MPRPAPLMTQTPNGPWKNRTNAAVVPLVLAVLVKVCGQYFDVELLRPLAVLLTEQVLVGIMAFTGVVVPWFRSRVGRKALPKVKRKLPVVPPAAWLLALAVALASCGAHWPKGCTQTSTAITCSVRSAQWHILPHPSKPRPAGRVVLQLDGEQLPVIIDADEVAKP